MNNKVKIAIQLILGFWKSVIFNFHYFPLKQAIRFPVLIGSNCKLDTLHGKVIIDVPIKTGMILIGVGPSGLFDYRIDKSSLCLTSGGVLTFHGSARFGPGIRLLNNGRIEIGNNFTVTGSTKIICSKQISFGDDVLLSWDILVMDKDYHQVLYPDHASDIKEEISIGNHVWIACRSSILKGSIIGDDSVVAAMSCVNSKSNEKGCLLAGVPAKIIRKDIDWRR